jgi:GTPase SAR1 family protein
MKLKEDNFLDCFMETSAKNGFNVEKVFFDIASILYKDTIEKNKLENVRLY